MNYVEKERNESCVSKKYAMNFYAFKAQIRVQKLFGIVTTLIFTYCGNLEKLKWNKGIILKI